MEKKVSIKELANKIKNPGISSKEQVEEDEVKTPAIDPLENKKEHAKEGIKKEAPKGGKGASSDKKVQKRDKSPTTLLEEFEISNQRNDYNLTKAVHIDEDVHEVFTKLKAASKLRIGKYLSYKMEMLILEHQKEILEIINSNNKNKFLGK